MLVSKIKGIAAERDFCCQRIHAQSKGQSPDRADATGRKNNFAESQRRGRPDGGRWISPQGFIN